MIVSAQLVRGYTPPDPHRRLVAAIIARSVRDLQKRGSAVARDAAAYVNSPNFSDDCITLGYDPDTARAALRTYLEEYHA